MGVATRKTSKRTPPATLRSQKDIARQSPMSRLRSRSYSHDNELYRMGLRKDAEGEWAVPADGRVPAGLVNAMRALRLRSIKREPADDEEMGVAVISGGDEVIVITADQNNRDAAVNPVRVSSSAEDGVDGDVLMVDMMDSTAVFEEIRIYLDVDREIEGGHVMVDEHGYELKTVMHSVEEVNMDFGLDVKMSGVSADLSVDVEQLDGARESLASIAENDEDDMDATTLSGDEQQRLTSDEPPGEGLTSPKFKKPHKWSEEQFHYIGALSDAGYKLPAIVDSLASRYPDIGKVTKATIIDVRLNDLTADRLQRSRLLGQELGLESGKWRHMEIKMLRYDQEREGQVVMEQQQQEFEAGYRELVVTRGTEERRIMYLKLHNIFTAQRTRWREFMTTQCQERKRLGLSFWDFPDWQNRNGIVHLVQLMILVGQSKELLTNPQGMLGTWSYPTERPRHLISKWKTLHWATRPRRPDNTADWRACEYDLAMLYIEDRYSPAAKIDYHHEVADLLLLEEEILENDIESKRMWEELHWSRRKLCQQQDERSLAFKSQRIDVNGAEAAIQQPLQAPEIIDLLYGSFEERWLIQTLLSVEEEEKINLEAGLRAVRESIELDPESRHRELNKFYREQQAIQDKRDRRSLLDRIRDQQNQRTALLQQQGVEENNSNNGRPQPLEASELTDLLTGWTRSVPKRAFLVSLLDAKESDKIHLEASLRTARAAIELEPESKGQRISSVCSESLQREHEIRRRILHDQQNRRRALFQQQRDAESRLAIYDEPLEASSIIAFLAKSDYEREVVYALVTSEEEEKVIIEAELRERMRKRETTSPKFQGWLKGTDTDPASGIWRSHMKRKRERDAEMPENKHLTHDTLWHRDSRSWQAEPNGLRFE